MAAAEAAAAALPLVAAALRGAASAAMASVWRGEDGAGHELLRVGEVALPAGDADDRVGEVEGGAEHHEERSTSELVPPPVLRALISITGSILHVFAIVSSG